MLTLVFAPFDGISLSCVVLLLDRARLASFCDCTGFAHKGSRNKVGEDARRAGSGGHAPFSGIECNGDWPDQAGVCLCCASASPPVLGLIFTTFAVIFFLSNGNRSALFDSAAEEKMAICNRQSVREGGS